MEKLQNVGKFLRVGPTYSNHAHAVDRKCVRIINSDRQRQMLDVVNRMLIHKRYSRGSSGCAGVMCEFEMDLLRLMFRKHFDAWFSFPRIETTWKHDCE